MANVLNKNPLVIDTLNANALITDDLFVRTFAAKFGATSVAGDQIIVQDASGNEVWRANSTGANSTDEISFSDARMGAQLFHGLKVPTLTAGHSNLLEVYLG